MASQTMLTYVFTFVYFFYYSIDMCRIMHFTLGFPYKDGSNVFCIHYRKLQFELGLRREIKFNVNGHGWGGAAAEREATEIRGRIFCWKSAGLRKPARFPRIDGTLSFLVISMVIRFN